jgi:hypothetical protein
MLKIFIRKTSLFVHSFFSLIYLKIYIIPILKIKKIVIGNLIIVKSYKSYIVITEALAIKISISTSSTINNEFYLYEKILAFYPELVVIFPNYTKINLLFINAIQYDKLNEIPLSESLSSALMIQDKLSCKNLFDIRFKVDKFPHIYSALIFFKSKFGFEIFNFLLSLVEKFLTNENYKVGLAHGDFHSRNLMKDRNGAVKIIDLDCFRFCGIREFDLLYFSLEIVWSLKGIHWIDTLIEKLKGHPTDLDIYLNKFNITWSKSLGVSFFLDRLGQDLINYKIKYSHIILQRVLNAIQ